MSKKCKLYLFSTILIIFLLFFASPITAGDLPHSGGFYWIERNEGGHSFIFFPN